MGYFSVLNRRDRKQILHSNVLFDSSDKDDELTGFLPGDTIILSLEVDDQTAELFRGKILKGVNFGKKTFLSEDEPLKFVVEIEFRVVKRSHQVLRDWMTQKIGFRSTGTLLCIEAVSDEAEELFLKLQKSFDANIENLI